MKVTLFNPDRLARAGETANALLRVAVSLSGRLRDVSILEAEAAAREVSETRQALEASDSPEARGAAELLALVEEALRGDDDE